MKKRIVIVFTATVASTLFRKIIDAFCNDGYEVSLVISEHATHFISYQEICRLRKEEKYNICMDIDEWFNPVYIKGQAIPHIDIAKNNDVLLIIASANFLAQAVNGICSDLASSLYRAWHRDKPIVIAPAMNTHMWTHPVTLVHTSTLRQWGVSVINPVSKKLACGDEGIGALADINFIKEVVDGRLENVFPINCFNGIPVQGHPGAFLTCRKHAKHTGVDLYTNNNEPVYSMNDGIIVSIEDFTGIKDNSPWWEDTQCILIKHWFGVVCYGEISVCPYLRAGDKISRRQLIGQVKRVLKPGKERPDIQGHSTSMLHLELYPETMDHASKSYEIDKDNLLDPTPLLLEIKRSANGTSVNPHTLLQNSCCQS